MSNSTDKSVNSGLFGPHSPIFAYIYCVIVAIGDVWINLSSNQYNTFALLAIISTAALIIYLLLTVNKLKQTLTFCRENPKIVASLNILVAITWVTNFWSLHFLLPSVSATLFMFLIPMIAFLKKDDKSQFEWKIFVVMALVCVMLIAEQLYVLPPEDFTRVFWGVVVTIVGSFFSVIFFDMSHKVSKMGLSTNQIVSTRFIVLIAIAFGFSTTEQIGEILNNEGLVMLLSFIIIIAVLPMYLGQKSVAALGGERFAFFLPSIPAIAYAIQMMTGKYEFAWSTFITALIACSILVLREFYMAKQNKAQSKEEQSKEQQSEPALKEQTNESS